MDFSFCTDYVYSEDYYNVLLRYDRGITDIYANLLPECVTMINERYAVGYVRFNKPYELSRVNYENIPKCYGLMDLSVIQDTGTDRISALPGINATGRGVILGFVDTGIDYRNPSFINEYGSRIEYIWDQTEEVFGSSEPAYGYGAVYNKRQIDEALSIDEPYELVPTRDENGHGTFIASVACGGIDSNEPFQGIAPNADIMMVKLKQAKQNLKDFYFISNEVPCYSEDDILLGISFLIGKAIELGRPLVLCLGIGTNQGNHNGTTFLEQFLVQAVNLRGFCVVCSAGNELGVEGHFTSNMVCKRNNQISMEISVDGPSQGFSMELWGRAPGIIRPTLVSPTGEIYTEIPFSQDGEVDIRFLYEGTRVYISNTLVDDLSGDQLIVFRFDKPTQGIWTILASEYTGISDCIFDAWLPISQFLDASISFVRPEPDVIICSPGNTRGTICVAGYNHTNNSLYYRSSRGYTRDGLVKPDITAPSVNVQGVLSTSNGKILYIRRSGTSVGAAVTAGAAALIMEWAFVQGNYPIVNTEIIRQMLIRGVKYVSEGEYPNNIWGYGVLDLYNSFEQLRRRGN